MAMDQPNGLSAKVVHAVGAAGCVALLGLGYLLGIAPMQSGGVSPTELSAAVREAEQQAALQEAVTQRLSDELGRAEEERASKPMQLTPSTHANRRVAALSALAHDCGLTLTTSQPGGETMLSYYAFVPVMIGGDGQFGDFVRFLGELHEQFPDMGVQGFEVVRNPLGGGRFVLALNWFVEPARTAEVS